MEPIRRYGTPYQGSKNAIARRIIDALPPGGVLVDAFCGGCAITHAAILSGKFGQIICNDLYPVAQQLFKNATEGKYRNETRWISRDDFNRLKDTDPYVAICWSFGNNQGQYLYSKEIEPWKKALHHARALGDHEPLRKMGINGSCTLLDVKKHADEYKDKYIRWWLSENGYPIEDLEELKRRCNNQLSVQSEELRQYLLKGLASSGMTQAEVGRRLGTQMTGHYFGRSQWEFPTKEYYDKMRTFMPALKKEYFEIVGLRDLWNSLQSLQSLQSLESLQGLQSLQSLESLQRLQSLQSLQSLQHIEYVQGMQYLPDLQYVKYSQTSYDELVIPDGAVVYCDPPYKGTEGYKNRTFDHERFYDWCEETAKRARVFISEYDMPADRFKPLESWSKAALMSSAGNGKCTERLFVPINQKDHLPRQLSLFES